MTPIIVSAPWYQKAFVVFFLILIVGVMIASIVFHDWFWFIYGGVLSCACLLVTAEAFASYQADEVGISKVRWIGSSELRWDEIARYRVRVRAKGSGVIYIFYDSEGRRRLTIDFGWLGKAGEPLLDLLTKKLPELLPNQKHQQITSPQSGFWVHPNLLPDDPAERERIIFRHAGGYLRCGIYFLIFAAGLTVWAGWQRYPHFLLLRGGKLATGVVTEVMPVEYGRHTSYSVSYRFTVPEGVAYAGETWVSKEEAQRLRVDGPIEVRYLPADPQVHELATEWQGSWWIFGPIMVAMLPILVALWFFYGRRRVLRLLPNADSS